MTTPETLTQFTRQGLRFDVHDAGPLDGRPVILLHGFPQDSSCWQRVTPALHKAGLRTLALDQRGYSPGASPRPVSAYALPHLVDDVLALADAAGLDRFHVVGHDWGGGVAWQLAARAPQRLSSLTVLSTPHPDALVSALPRSDQGRKSWYMAAFQVPGIPERVLAPRVGRFLVSAGMTPELAARYESRFATPDSLRGPINWYRALLRGGLRDSSPRTISVPTTYVWGSGDVALGRTAAEATSSHVDADYRFVELDATHWLPEMNPGEVSEAILQRVG